MGDLRLDARAPRPGGRASRRQSAHQAFAAMLERTKAPILDGPGGLLGIEHEFDIMEGERRRDFRALVQQLAAHAPRDGRALGPHAYMFDGGTLLICDGREAEIAIPAVPIGAAAIDSLAGTVAGHHAVLGAALDGYNRANGTRLRARGYSTHFSLSAALLDLDATCRLYARAMAPAMMLFEGVPGETPGLLLRPRDRRFEIGGEFVPPSDDLAAASVFALASFLAVADAMNRGGPDDLPCRFAPALKVTRQRFGFFVEKSAFGEDIYRHGRSAALRLADGSTVLAQQVLERCWSHARGFVADRLSPRALALVDARVAGEALLPCEQSDVEAYLGSLHSGAAGAALPDGPYSLRPLVHNGTRLTPAITTWDFIVYGLEGHGGSAFVNVPRGHLEGFHDLYRSGGLDAVFERATAGRPGGGRLAEPSDAQGPGIFDAVDEAELVAPMVGGRSSKKKKKKPEGKDPLCVVVEDEQAKTIDIYVPMTWDDQLPLGKQEPPASDRKVARDVFIHNGCFATDSSDLFLHGLGMNFEFTRSYRSKTRYDGVMGHCWDHQFNIRLVPHRANAPNFRNVKGGWCERFEPGGISGPITFHHGTGRVTEHAFKRWEIREMHWCSGTFRAVVSTYAQNDGEDFEIERYAVLSGKPPPVIKDAIFYRMRVRDGTRVLFNCHGYVKEIRDRNFNAFTFNYGSPFNEHTGYWTLESVVDSSARTHRLKYRRIANVERVVRLIDFDNKVVDYDYDGSGQLVRAELVRGSAGRPTIGYRYHAGGRTGLLAEIVQPVDFASGRSCIGIGYDGDERVVTQRVGSAPGATPTAGGTYRLDYGGGNRVTVSDRLNIEHRYVLQDLGSSNVVIEESLVDDVFENGQLQAAKRLVSRYQYDRHFHVVRIDHPGGGFETFSFRNRNEPVTAGNEYDDLGAHVTHWNDLGRDAMLSKVRSSANGQITFATSFEYEWLYNSVTRIVAPLGTTFLDYDHGWCHAPERNGNPVRVERPPQQLPDGTSLPVVETYMYLPGGLVQQHRAPDGEEHSFLYDDRGRMLYHFTGGTTIASYQYDNRSHLTVQFDERGKQWLYAHDDRGNLTKEIDPLNHEKSATFDLNDRRVGTSAKRVDDVTIQGLTPQAELTIEHVFTLDALGHLRELQQKATPAGGAATSRTWRWAYDAEERLASEETPRATSGQAADAKTEFRYNNRGLVAEQTQGAGGAQPATAKTWYTLDGAQSCSEDPVGQKELVTYDGIGRIETRTSPDGTVTSYAYAGPKLVRDWVEGPYERAPAALGGQTVRCILAETHYLLDQDGNVIKRTAKCYDPLQRTSLASTVSMSDASWESYHSPGGKLTREVDALGLATSHLYDGLGRLDTTTLPGGHTITRSYDGLLQAKVVAHYLPDAGFSAQPPAAPFDVTEEVKYDALGRVAQKTDNNKLTTDYAYDSLGNLRATKGPLSLVEQTWDAFSRPETETRDGVRSGSNPDGLVKLRFEHDLNDNRTVSVDDRNRRTVIVYDGRDQPSNVTLPDQPAIGILRYPDGNPRTVTRGAGRRVEYDYTETGLLRRTRYFDGTRRTEQAFGYDGLGHPTYALDSNDTANRNRVQRYREHDSMGRLTLDRLVIPEFNFDDRVRYAFSADHKDRTILYPGLSPPITYETGPDGNVKRISEFQSTLISRLHQGPGRNLETRRRITISVQSPTPQLHDLGLVEAYRFDDTGRTSGRVLLVEEKIIDPAASRLMALTIAEKTVFGPTGMLDLRSRDGVDTTYIYDGAQRLTSYTEKFGGDQKTTAFNWDGTNRLHETRITSVVGGVPRVERNPTQYFAVSGARSDRFGSLGVTSVFDRHGRMTESDDYVLSQLMERRYSFDAADRLKQSRIREFGLGGMRTDPEYLYDAFGRLVARIGGRAGGALANRPRVVFLHDGDRPILEQDEQGREVRSYVYDEAGELVAYRFIHPALSTVVDSLPLSAMDGSPWYLLDRRISLPGLPPNKPDPNDPLPTRQAYYRDWLPVILEQHRTPPFAANEVRQYTYFAASPATSSIAANSYLPINSAGQLRFSDEGLQLNGHRFYYPAIRSFMTPDAAGHWGDPASLGNAHTYAGNNPVNFVDPDGMLAWDATSDVVFAIWGFGDAVYETELYRRDLRHFDQTKAEASDVWKAWGLFTLDLVGLLPILPNVTRPALIFYSGYKSAMPLWRGVDHAVDASRLLNRAYGTYSSGTAAIDAYADGGILYGTVLGALTIVGVKGSKQDAQELCKKHLGKAHLKLDMSDVVDLAVRKEIETKFAALNVAAQSGGLSVGSGLHARFKRQFYSTGNRRYPASFAKRLKALYTSMPHMRKKMSSTAQDAFKTDFWRKHPGPHDGFHVDHRIDLQFLEGRMLQTNAFAMLGKANTEAGRIVAAGLLDLKLAGWRPGSRIGKVTFT